jgi:asparagine synthase (glutamine-hydrolysing)
MSGIFGFVHLDGAPAERSDLERMARLMERRGPDGTGLWLDGSVALGHTLLATTPESLSETLPLRHSETGCVITADVRLDNRPELMAALGDSRRLAEAGDGTLLLEAYLRWGDACVDHLLGDFAFAIWDPRHRRLFAARDHMGMRQLIHHHQEGRFFAFATEPRAVLALPRTPYRINEAKVADFIVSGVLEDIEYTASFFEEILNLAPGHKLSLASGSLDLASYWRPEPQPELRLGSNNEYAEAFLEIFTEAVRCRLRAPYGKVGAMLSGGMDSGSIAGVARMLMLEEGREPLVTLSVVGPDAKTCLETRNVHAFTDLPHLRPILIDHSRLEPLVDDLQAAIATMDDPKDCHLNLCRAVYLSASRQGVKVVLDGVGGDTTFHHGTHLIRLIMAGQLRRGWQESAALARRWQPYCSARKLFLASLRSAVVPEVVRRYRARRAPLKLHRRALGRSFINHELARRVHLDERCAIALGAPSPLSGSFTHERAAALSHPSFSVGNDAYDRISALFAVERRDPMNDVRVARFALSLPGEQLLDDGWTKVVLRRTMQDMMPDSVRWTFHKEHLGWAVTQRLFMPPATLDGYLFGNTNLRQWVNIQALENALKVHLNRPTRGTSSRFYALHCTLGWIDRHLRLCYSSDP